MKNIDSAINQHNSWKSKTKHVDAYNKKNGTNWVHDVEICARIVNEWVNTQTGRIIFEKVISEKARVYCQIENSRIGSRNKNKGEGLKSFGHLYTLALGRTRNKFGDDAVITDIIRADKMTRSVNNDPLVIDYFQTEFRNIIEELINL